ncbi:MAG: hypothetical protein ACFE0J_06750 [Elainellaceae cyanobacterium]
MDRSSREQHIAEFNASVRDAIAYPDTADWSLLIEKLEQILANSPQDIVLNIAGEAIAQLAELHAARAESLLENWQTQYAPSSSNSLIEPVLTDDMLAGVLRHTMSLNLDELLEEADLQQRRRHANPEDSIAGDVDKDAVLGMVDQIEETQAVLAPAYEESISEWSAIISQWIAEREQPIDLETILKEIQLSPVRVWLGLLLASSNFEWHYQWGTDDEFYCPANISISTLVDRDSIDTLM